MKGIIINRIVLNIFALVFSGCGDNIHNVHKTGICVHYGTSSGVIAAYAEKMMGHAVSTAAVQSIKTGPTANDLTTEQ